MSVHIVDAPMGVGKTSGMINYMNAAPPGSKFIFVTPYLDEGDRIAEACPTLNFQVPETDDNPDPKKRRSKMVDFKIFLRDQRNIVTTHALFERFDVETERLIIEGHYTLVMDEVADVIRPYKISPYDAKRLNQTCVDKLPNGQLAWRESDRNYYGRYLSYKMDCDAESLWYYNDSVIVEMLPISAFDAFEQIFVMTYMFDAQLHRCYFDIFGIEFEYMHVEGDSLDTYTLVPGYFHYTKPGLDKLIHIYDDRKLRMRNLDRNTLSSQWYEKHKDTTVTQVRNNCYNFFRHHMGVKAEDTLWTCFREKSKTWQEEEEQRDPYFSPRSYASGFLACNARATNKYRDRTVLAYPVNRFLNPHIYNFLVAHGTTINQDQWALSEMIQWIWRSAIRDGKEITIYIPSDRMRTLLENWIAEMSSTGLEGGDDVATVSPYPNPAEDAGEKNIA